MVKKKYASQVKDIREKICLIAYPAPTTGPEIAQQLYGDRHKYATLYSRYLPELKEKGYIKDLGRGKGFLATPKPFLEEIAKRAGPFPSKEKRKIYNVLDSEAFRAALSGTYTWVEDYNMHPYNCVLNMAGFFAIGALQGKKFSRGIRSKTYQLAKNNFPSEQYEVGIPAYEEFMALSKRGLKVFLKSMDPFARTIIEQGSIKAIGKASKLLKKP